MAERYVVIFDGTGDARYGPDRSAAKAAFVGVDSTDSYKLKYRGASGALYTLASNGQIVPELAMDAVVAGATQTQAGATALTGQVNRVGTVTTAGDGVSLPAATVGLIITVVNDGANPMKVYGATPDTINSITTTTGLYQGTGTVATYVCTVAGNWKVSVSQLQGTIPVALAASGAVLPDVPQCYRITKAGVAALTLAAPAAASDGNLLIVSSETANAHTLTATGLLQTGDATTDVATFNAAAGASLILMARNQKYLVLSANGISFS